MAERKGAEIIADHLVREHVPYVVALCGHGNLGLLDALYDRRGEIRTISVHHESVAGFVADAYHRIRHEPISTLTSCGPGSANLPIALGSAFMDGSAFLAITGNVPTSQFNRGPFQETGRYYQADFPSVLRPYVKRSFQATRAEQLPLMLRQAFALMRQGRPGPVHLDVPLDVFVERATTSEEQVRDAPGVSLHAAARAEEIDELLDRVLAATRPVVVAGYGVENAGGTEELRAFVRAAGLPLVTSPLGKAVADPGSPLSLGASGRNGTYQANRATRSADVVLALGTRFDDRATSSWLPGYTYRIPPTTLLQVDLEPEALGRNYPVTVGLAANPRDALQQLREGLERRRQQGDERARPDSPCRRRWLADIATWRERWEEHVAPHRTQDGTPLRPERVLHDLRRALPTEGILVADVGVHHNWIVQEWRPGGPGTLLQSWGFASMGFGVAGVLGARLAAPARPVLAVVGDGGFLMHPSAVATAVEHGLPAVWLVWNNGGYISIRDQQVGYFGAGRELATSFRQETDGTPYAIDFAAMARSMGARGIRVGCAADLGEALEDAVSSEQPTVLDVPVDASVSLPAAASWDLPPLPHPEPTFGWPDR